jgi:hypothetical protein
MTEVEREVWIGFRSVATKFLGNKKEPDYVTIVENMLEKFSLGVLNELKNSFFEFALGLFSKILGAVSEGERFHQDIKKMEKRYQGRWNVNMMRDYCWTRHREIPETSHKRKSKIHSFAGKRKRQYKATE